MIHTVNETMRRCNGIIREDYLIDLFQVADSLKEDIIFNYDVNEIIGALRSVKKTELRNIAEKMDIDHETLGQKIIALREVLVQGKKDWGM